jgi:hypothetical protein
MIKTDKETEQRLKLLRADADVLPADDPGFSALVWARVSHSPHSVFTLTPVYALTALSAVLFLLFWIYYQPVPVSEKPVFEDIPIVGAMLDVSPDLTAQAKTIVEEGDFLATGPDGQITFFLPGAGYFHLMEDSKIEIKKARRFAVPGTAVPGTIMGFQYDLFLETGALYSKLEKLETGSALKYLTPHGQASVLGTDFLLSVKKDFGTGIQVLNGVVKVTHKNDPDAPRDVQSGFEALISPNLAGTLLVTELEGAKLAELKDTFTDIFKGSREPSKRNTSNNFRILSHREMKWEK